MKNVKIKIWIKENLKYIILFAFLGIFLFAYPFVMSNAQYIKENSNEDILYFRNHMITSFYEIMLLKLFFWFMPAIALALRGFSYLFSEKKINFYHSLPITRTNLFFKNYITGFLIFLISQFFIYIVFGIELASFKCFSNDEYIYIVQIFIVNVFSFLPMYSISIFVIMITGNLFIALMGIFIVYIYFPLISICCSGIREVMVLSPMYFQSKAGDLLISIEELLKNKYYRHCEINFDYLQFYMVSILTSFAFNILSLILYKLRNLEKVNETIVFDIAKKIIRVMLAVCFASVAFVVFGWFSISKDGIYSYIIITVSALSAHSILEMIINKDFNSFKNDIIEKLLSVIISMILLWF